MGEIGELWVRGPQVMQGYWNNPVETANVTKARWVACDRRHRACGSRRLLLHRGSEEGHDPVHLRV